MLKKEKEIHNSKIQVFFFFFLGDNFKTQVIAIFLLGVGHFQIQTNDRLPNTYNVNY
jgi:hypothetical protein